MKPTDSPDWVLFREQFPLFMRTYRRLAREPWFSNEEWTAFIAHYRAGIYMQIYKLHWHNHLHEGIHLELAQNEQLRASKQINLELHAHREGLGDLRDRLNDEICDGLQALTDELGAPFEYRPKSLSGKISATFGCSPSSFAVKAANHIELLRPVGQIIDDALVRLDSVDIQP